MELSAQEVRDIAELAKVGMSPEEVEIMRGQLSDILERFRALSEVDTDGVETTAHPSGVASVLRDDVAEECQTQDETMANAPRRQGEFVRVRAVLE
jgi:aspartyl-tRNA(Asn)/glutamyl-tRNA(Gln) amidotransferase subunit C